MLGISDQTPSAEEILPSSNPFGDVSQSQGELERLASLSAVLHTVRTDYQTAKDARTPNEAIWLASFNANSGELSPEEKAGIARARERNQTASEIFIKITKTKAMAALGQIQEILFSNNNLPIAIEATPEPDGIAKEAFIVPEQVPIPDDIYGYQGDGKEIEPGATSSSILSGLYDKYKTLLTGKKVIEGPSPDQNMFPQVNPAEEAAANMQRIILDQMEEGELRREIRRAAWECVVLGTGCIKGPLTYKNTIHTWKQDGETNEIKYEPKVEDLPVSSFVSIWNLYPDPDCVRIDDAAYVIEKHLLTRHQVAELKKYDSFDKEAIDRILRTKPTRNKEAWEDALRDSSPAITDTRYEFLEYWGYLSPDHIINIKPSLKKQLESLTDQAQVNIWVCDSEIVKLVVNPFVPSRHPYYIVPYEEQEYQVWGKGIPENMKDPQALMNGHARMWIDNLRFAGNVILEVNDTLLVNGQDNTLYPGKVFHKQSGSNQPSLQAINIPNVAPAHMQAFDKARQLADEVTGQPSYSHGQTGVSGTTRTAAGMSMLMSAAAGNVKQVVRNFDEYLLEPIGQAYFNWNMQFNDKATIRGDLKVVAKGTASLMQKEVQSQRLLQFLQIVSGNQLLTPFANLDYILKEIARSLDLDPDKTVNDPKMAKLVADIMGAINNPAMSAQQLPQEGAPQGQGNISANDETGGGGGQIGVGSAPQPGTPQFTGN